MHACTHTHYRGKWTGKKIFEKRKGCNCITFLFQDKTAQVESERAMMEEERQRLAKEIEKWEKEFKKKNKREPSDDDK